VSTILLATLALSTLRSADTIPPKTVVLTFDDAVRSHLTVVAPLLKEYGFGATFFICHAWMEDKECFLTWEEVAKLNEMGFEIGNHTWTHASVNTPRTAARLAGEIALVENELKKVGVPKPITFGWTGNQFGPEAIAVLEKAGFRLGRRGMQPEAAYASLQLGPLFDPQHHHALLIPSAGDAYPDWTLDHFKAVVDRAEAGKAAIVQFHGVPDVKHPWVHTPEERFREYMDYLKRGGFHVIAMRDLLPYLPDKPVDHDPMSKTRYSGGPDNELFWPPEVNQTRERLDFWLDGMRQHGYSAEEMMQVAGLSEKEVKARPEVGDKIHLRAVTKMLPYPGGRHPRIGFLDGAVDPLRGTKASIFLPWENGGYAVLDIPEAIFSNLGLTFLAHTHIPTIWDDKNVVVENQDWAAADDGSLRSEWKLDNGISFGAQVAPVSGGADLELWLLNGTPKKLTGLRTQVCLMLKGAPGFAAQDNIHKQFESPLATAQSADGKHWILLAFERCGRAWGNDKCPCMHSDPVFPDADPGARVSVRGRLRFCEDSEAEKAREAVTAFAK